MPLRTTTAPPIGRRRRSRAVRCARPTTRRTRLGNPASRRGPTAAGGRRRRSSVRSRRRPLRRVGPRAVRVVAGRPRAASMRPSAAHRRRMRCTRDPLGTQALALPYAARSPCARRLRRRRHLRSRSHRRSRECRVGGRAVARGNRCVVPHLAQHGDPRAAGGSRLRHRGAARPPPRAGGRLRVRPGMASVPVVRL